MEIRDPTEPGYIPCLITETPAKAPSLCPHGKRLSKVTQATFKYLWKSKQTHHNSSISMKPALAAAFERQPVFAELP